MNSMHQGVYFLALIPLLSLLVRNILKAYKSANSTLSLALTE